VDDGIKTGPVGTDLLHLPMAFSGVVDPDIKEIVSLILSGDILKQAGVALQLTLADGSSRRYTPVDGTIRIAEFDVNGRIPDLSGELLIPKGQAYGAHSISAAVETLDGVVLSSPQLAVSCDFAVVSAAPAVPSVGVSVDAQGVNSGFVNLSDIVRVPGAIANQHLELSGMAGNSALFTRDAEGFHPLASSVLYSVPVLDIGNYWVHPGSSNLISFRARVAMPDYGGAGESYSRFVDYSVTAGLAVDGSTTGDNWLISDGAKLLDAGDGNDTVQLLGLSSSILINGGNGHDTLIMGGLAEGIVVDLNLGWIVAPGGTIAIVEGFESFVGTAHDDFFIGSEVDVTGVSVRGGGGDDWLVGSAGNDVLEGGSGNDYLEGGAGADRFVMMPGGGNDVIGDFDPLHDRIEFAGFGFARGQLPSDVLSMQLVDQHWRIALTQNGTVSSFTFAEPSSATTGQQVGDERAAIAAAIDLVEGVDLWAVDPLPAAYPLGFDPSNPEAIPEAEYKRSNGPDDLEADGLHPVLFGAAGNDVLHGDAAANVLVGGAGTDDLFGGAGNDLFVFIKALESPADQELMAVVEDFNRQDGDRIVIAGFNAAPEIMAVQEKLDTNGDIVWTQTVHLENYSIIFNLTQQRNSEHEFQLRQADFDRL
jgi:hypothetical protein